MNTVFQGPELHDVERILSKNNLPTGDLSEVDLGHFFACGDIANPKGVIGLEVYESDGLLRSLSVDSDVQGEGCGSLLFQRLEQHSKTKGIKTLYLLTETAQSYFESKGFQSIARELAPETIKQTSEFSGLCPDSATLMRKFI